MTPTKTLLGALCTLALIACGNSEEQRAQAFLQAAESARQAGDYNSAKIQIDSVRIQCPHAFEARREGVKLMQRVELEEQQRGILFLDSLKLQRQQELETIKGKFVLERDTVYQEVGNYFYPTQTVEKNLNRTFLRAQVSERGDMSLTSIYCGSSNIHHTAVKVSVGDSYAETPASADVYETTDLGRKIEKADYPLGKDGDVAAFIHTNRNEAIRLEFIGDRNHKMAMPATDRTAIAEIYELAQVLSSLEEIRKAREEADRKIEFINRKMKETAQKEAAQ